MSETDEILTISAEGLTGKESANGRVPAEDRVDIPVGTVFKVESGKRDAMFEAVESPCGNCHIWDGNKRVVCAGMSRLDAKGREVRQDNYTGVCEKVHCTANCRENGDNIILVRCSNVNAE